MLIALGYVKGVSRFDVLGLDLANDDGMQRGFNNLEDYLAQMS